MSAERQHVVCDGRCRFAAEAARPRSARRFRACSAKLKASGVWLQLVRKLQIINNAEPADSAGSGRHPTSIPGKCRSLRTEQPLAGCDNDKIARVGRHGNADAKRPAASATIVVGLR